VKYTDRRTCKTVETALARVSVCDVSTAKPLNNLLRRFRPFNLGAATIHQRLDNVNQLSHSLSSLPRAPAWSSTKSGYPVDQQITEIIEEISGFLGDEIKSAIPSEDGNAQLNTDTVS